MKLAYNSLPPFRKDEPQKLPFCYQFIQEISVELVVFVNKPRHCFIAAMAII